MDTINPMAFWSNENHIYDADPQEEATRKAKLQEWLGTPGSSTDIGVGSRLAYGAAALGPRTIEGLAMGAGTIANWMGATSEKAAPFVPALPAGKDGYQSAADFAGAIAPYFLGGEIAKAPIQGITAMTGLTKAAPVLSRALAQGGEFAALSTPGGDGTTTAEQFGEGALGGAITALMPRGIGRAIAATGLGLGSKMFFDRNGGQPVAGDWTQGDIAGAALGITTAFMGKPVPKWTPPVVGEIPTRIPEVPQTNYNLRNTIDARTGVINPGGRSAADSAAAMQAAWGFDPNATNIISTDPLAYSAADSAAFMQQSGVGRIPELREPDPALQSLQLTNRQQMLAEQQARLAHMPSAGPDVPLLPYGGNDNPMAPILDMHQPQTLDQLTQRSPLGVGQSPSGLYYAKKAPAIPMEGPIRPVDAPPSPDYLTQQLFNPANQPAIQEAAFGNNNPQLLHQGQMTLQALQTDWFAQDVLQAGRQQTHDFVSWMQGLDSKPTVPEILNASPIARLAKSPNIPVEDIATELRSYSDTERAELGQAVNVDPTDTTALAHALKEHFDPSLRPRTPPQTRMSEADIQAMLAGEPPNPNLSPMEQAAYNRFKSEGGNVDPALLYAGARGLIGAGAGYTIAGQDNMSEGEKWLAAAALGSAALFGPALMRTLGHSGEAEARIPQWGRPVPQRTALSIEPPPRNTSNPRLNELADIEHQRAATADLDQTLQRLQEESTRKGKVSDTPSWMRNEGGYTSPEMSAALARASTGALIGGTVGALVDDPNSHTGLVTGAVSGAILSMVGPAIIRRILSEAATAKSPQITATPTVAKAIATTVGARKFTMPELLAKAQLAVFNKTVLGAEPTVFDRSLARLDNWFGLSQGPSFSRVLGQSAGPTSFLTREVDNAFRKLSFVQADEGMRTLTTQYLNGELSRTDYLQQMSVDSNHKAYADFATVARDSMDGMIDIAARGQGNTTRSDMMRDSMGKYLTRSYRMFVDASYSPSVDSINKLAQKIADSGAWVDSTGTVKSVDMIKSDLAQYVKEIQQSKGIYRPDSGKKIDQTVFGHRKVIDEEWRQFLGEITDPVDRIRLTVLKLKPMSDASNFMHQVTNGLNLSDEGLRYAFSSSGELEAAQQSVLQRLQSNPSDSVLRKQLLELQQYRYVEADARYGALQGQYVHRNVGDVLNDWDQSIKVDSAAGRALMGINQMMKSNVTYRNPMATIRQALTAPFFLQIGKGFSGMGEAWDIVRNENHPMHKELMDNGISNVDAITKDVLRDVDRINNGLVSVNGIDAATAFLGRIDQNLAKAGAAGKLVDSKMADLFKMPDNFVRVATYLSAKTRFANELGAALDSPEVINKAVEWTNRYTMNYNLLPKAVVKGRNVPFVNMFISYAAEMGRLMKNLGEDLVSKDSTGSQRMHAIMALGTVSALPELLQRTSESGLSEKDKKEWEKVKAGMPVYAKDRSYMVSRDQASGKFRIYDFSNLMPADQFQQTIRALSEGRILDAAKNNPVVGWDTNPALNLAATYITGKDRYTGRQLRGPVDYATSAAKEVGGPFTPGVGSQWEKFQMANSINANGTRGITDKRGRTLTTEDFWLPYATAIKAGYIDPKAIEQSAISEYKSSVANEMAYFNDVRRANWPADVVERAAGRTKEALQQLQDRLNRQLGITPTAPAIP